MANPNTQHNQSTGSRPDQTKTGGQRTDQQRTDQQRTDKQRPDQQQPGQRADRKHDSEEFKKSSSKETGSGGRETSEDEDMGEDLNH